jgi:hypothetical protein
MNQTKLFELPAAGLECQADLTYLDPHVFSQDLSDV